jgi:hypothetical protein
VDEPGFHDGDDLRPARRFPASRGRFIASPTGPCDEPVYWFDGEREAKCNLSLGHYGPHHDGAAWFDDDGCLAEPPLAGSEP